LLERLAKLAQQPRVLDCDDGLSSKIPNQFDLLVGEGPHLLAIDDNCTNYLILLKHRDSDQGPRTGKVDRSFAQLVPVRR
jgi:hypothetical protein